MDFLPASLVNPTAYNSPLLALAFQAKQLLERIGWTYYTIWGHDTTPHPPGLAWSRGDVNESLLAHERGKKMGLLLQEFYKHCTFLPLGAAGGLAGEALERGQYRWASGEELLLQIKILSIQNQKTPPPELQLLYFKTILYIPLGKEAGVLEIGTDDLVPKRECPGILYQILAFFNGLPPQGTSRQEEQIKSLLYDVGNHPDEQYRSASMVDIFCDTTIFRHPSNMSSYWSSSSLSPSTPSASEQQRNNSIPTFALDASPSQVSSMMSEDMLINPGSSLHSTALENKLHELNILNPLEDIDIYETCMPDLHTYGVDNAELIHFSHDHHLHFSDLPLNTSSTNMPVLPPFFPLAEDSCYSGPHSQPTAHDNHLLDSVIQPIQCGFSARYNHPSDTHRRGVRSGVSTESFMACQHDVNTLPSVSCQDSSHSSSYSTDQQQQWGCMLPFINEEGRVFGQQAHAMASAAMSKIPSAEDNLGDKRLVGDTNSEIMPKQGAVVNMVKDEGSSRGKRKLMMEVNMHDDQGERVVSSSTGTSTIQDGGRYVGYASGSAEPGKGVGRYPIYAFGSADADKVVESSQDRGSYADGSAESYKVLGSLTGQGAGSYASGSPEGEKVVASSAMFSSSFIGAGGSNSPHEMNPAQVHHIHAERERRRRQKDCLKTLSNLVPKITKKDKVSILEGVIRHLTELKHRIRELEETKMALLHPSYKDQRKSFEDLEDDISSQEKATCQYSEDTIPHFQLNLIKTIQDVKINAFVFEIIKALQEKNLHCHEINSKFWEGGSILSIKILAIYKDGEKCSPTLEEVQHIKQWWKQR